MTKSLTFLITEMLMVVIGREDRVCRVFRRHRSARILIRRRLTSFALYNLPTSCLLIKFASDILIKLVTL